MNKQRLSITWFLEVIAISGLVLFIRGALPEIPNYELNLILPILIDIAFLAVFASMGYRIANLLGFSPMAGKIIMGVVAGPAVLGLFSPHSTGVELARVAGILFILLESGLHFDINRLKRNFLIALSVASVGVLVPLFSFFFLGIYVLNLDPLPSLFLGGLFSASSLSLSVQILRSFGSLRSDIADKIISSTLIDHILSVMILVILSRFSVAGLENTDITHILLVIALFFLTVYVMWASDAAKKLVGHINKHLNHTQSDPHTRLFFGSLIVSATLAAIVGLEPALGAFGLGIILSRLGTRVKEITWYRMEGYMHIFAGGFMVSIGMLLPRDTLLSPYPWLLAIVFTILAFLGKYVVRFLFRDGDEGHLVGYAMAIRGEIGIVFLALAVSYGILNEIFVTASLLSIIMLSILGSMLFEKEIAADSGARRLPRRAN